ncbi:MAG: signal peptidase II [Clostridiales bacterium]|nr:signal peptidase II [Clostridiales bacterium]
MPLIIGLLIIVIDQLVKFLSAAKLPVLEGGTLPLFEGVFHLTYVENRGAVYGFLKNAPYILVIVNSILIIGLVFFLIKKYKYMHTLFRYSIILILAGAIGNFADRMMFGYVRDMFDFRLINFAVFNVADAALTIGTTLLIMDLLFFHGKQILDNYEKTGKLFAAEIPQTEPQIESKDDE